MTPKEKFDTLYESFYQESYALYVEAIRDVLKGNRKIDYYLDAMGSQFFAMKNGDNLGSGDEKDKNMTPEMLAFLDGFAAEFYDCFRSVGFQVHRDKIITDW